MKYNSLKFKNKILPFRKNNLNKNAYILQKQNNKFTGNIVLIMIYKRLYRVQKLKN